MGQDVSSQQVEQFSQTAPLALPGTDAERARQQSRQRQALALLGGLCAIGLVILLRLAPANGLAEGPPPVPEQHGFQPPPLFQGWNKPDLALVVSGEQHGYLQPCGCSRPQLGGLARRYNFIQELKQKGWPVVAVDVGDIAPQKSTPQLSLKYRYAMQALEKIGYTAVGVGQTELSMPLVDAIAEHRLNHPSPKMLAATLRAPGAAPFILNHIEDDVLVAPANKNGPAVGIFGLVGPQVAGPFQGAPGLAFGNNSQLVKTELEKFHGKAQLTMLLYQGSNVEAEALADYCDKERQKNPKLARLDLLLSLSADEEPPSVPTTIKNAANQPIPTQIINIGHKGRYIGVVGVFKKGGLHPSYEFKYQLVKIGENFETKKGQEVNNPVMALMEDYAKEVKNGGYITKFPAFPHKLQIAFPNAKYVGSERCAGCHQDAYKKWEDMPGKNQAKLAHSRAFDSLVHAKNPSLRQHDGECVSCHVTGFNHKTGYADALRDGNQKMITKLRDVGCESCHGPGSEHVANTINPLIHAEMNPWKNLPPATKKISINKFCQTCHDIDNDVNWNFAKNWPLIEHPSPKK